MNAEPSLRQIASENNADIAYQQRRRELELQRQEAEIEHLRVVTQLMVQGRMPPSLIPNQLPTGSQPVTNQLSITPSSTQDHLQISANEQLSIELERSMSPFVTDTLREDQGSE